MYLLFGVLSSRRRGVSGGLTAPWGRAIIAADHGDDGQRRNDLDTRLQQMLSELRRALYEAISDSSDVHRTWQLLREEGYSLHLVVDCKREEERQDEEVLSTEHLEEPSFRIHGGDLAFLKSIGIDPTRRTRRRRG
ncbi:MAG TPA: hypothetical protein VMT16_00860 [Thermoanaerobaculia bacterium]|nr:hypothetical protein [Thermoanaerobaculia bacterium]